MPCASTSDEDAKIGFRAGARPALHSASLCFSPEIHEPCQGFGTLLAPGRGLAPGSLSTDRASEQDELGDADNHERMHLGCFRGWLVLFG